ncbi:hypothetical protein ASPNIDRAFT_54453 [Aspergillus niger ATCC 1015]|uniref:Uncharacterized protein n=1 Tax=Aspergillus niger (strain ATCC 1015 / CBS 113.46 / FGSC A1144 / LSHB Ac4 / NCTC 3858a / NRRL 328 / USDA 3528.7) TaxID=380704 RepID=G3XUY9_ASPNA|nr:hypothetical protein ASPNIDRAFT_54453 [Aspergillus niger ATCC 1015]
MMQGVYHPGSGAMGDAPGPFNPRFFLHPGASLDWRILSTCGPPGAQSAFNSVWDNADNAAIPVHFGIHVSNMRPIAVKRKENSLKPLPKPISEISTDTKQW